MCILSYGCITKCYECVIDMAGNTFYEGQINIYKKQTNSKHSYHVILHSKGSIHIGTFIYENALHFVAVFFMHYEVLTACNKRSVPNTL